MRPTLPPALRGRAGFTLLELVIVIALVAILTALGVVMSDEMLPRYRARKAALTFQSLAQECRAIAIRSGRECAIQLSDYDSSLADLSSNAGAYNVQLGNASRNSTTWDILPSETGASDNDRSVGTVDIGDAANQYYARRVSIAEWSSDITGGTGRASWIVFDPRGFVNNPHTSFDSSTGYMEIRFVNKVARAEGRTDDYIARVTRSGMVRVDPSINDGTSGLTSGTANTSSLP